MSGGSTTGTIDPADTDPGPTGESIAGTFRGLRNSDGISKDALVVDRANVRENMTSTGAGLGPGADPIRVDSVTQWVFTKPPGYPEPVLRWFRHPTMGGLATSISNIHSIDYRGTTDVGISSDHPYGMKREGVGLTFKNESFLSHEDFLNYLREHTKRPFLQKSAICGDDILLTRVSL